MLDEMGAILKQIGSDLAARSGQVVQGIEVELTRKLRDNSE